VIELNRAVLEQLRNASRKEPTIVPGATHLFEEKGALSEVAQLAAQWFVRYLGAETNRENQNRGTNGARETRSVH